MTYMLLLNCALKLVEEIILYYDARSKKTSNHINLSDMAKKFSTVAEFLWRIEVLHAWMWESLSQCVYVQCFIFLAQFFVKFLLEFL